MEEHDQLCPLGRPFNGSTIVSQDPCQCDLIRAVRFDELNKAKDPSRYRWGYQAGYQAGYEDCLFDQKHK